MTSLNKISFRANEFGTGKTGKPRARYMLGGYYSAGAPYGIFLDQFLKPIELDYRHSQQNSGIANLNNIANNAFASITNTNSAPSTSGTDSYLNATSNTGEFGNALIQVDSNMVVVPSHTRRTILQNLNAAFFDSDHPDRRIAYIQIGNRISAVDKRNPSQTIPFFGTSDHILPTIPTGLTNSSYGTSSYNLSRKEFIVASLTTTLNLVLYKNVDLVTNPSPSKAFSANGVTALQLQLTGSPAIAERNLDDLKIVLCNNGDIYVTIHLSTGLTTVFRATRSGDTYSALSSLIALSTSTHYNINQGNQYANKKIQSRDGGLVLMYASYHYYGSGLVGCVVDKFKSLVRSFPQIANSSFGCFPVPIGNTGIVILLSSNASAAQNNINGLYQHLTYRNQDGDTVSHSSPDFWLPPSGNAGTTDYIYLTAVSDYDLLTGEDEFF